MKSTRTMICVGAVLSAALAYAADEPYFHAGWKMLGAQAYQSQQHAQNHAQQLYYYNQIPANAPNLPKSKDDAKEIIANLKKSLADSEKALDKLKAESGKNKEAIALIESIKKHNALAREFCGMAEEACAKDHDGEDPAVTNCCTDMHEELELAKNDTAKLLKLLKIDKLDPPKKGAPAKK
jgi:hypothetical protein